MNASGTGIGRALRRAREVRGKSLEEASRETRIRSEYLQALEREAFERLLGDVYVRGFLRSYSSYLGLDADHVLTVYNRTYGSHRPTVPPRTPSPALAPDGDGHPLIHRPANWKGAAVLALGVLAVVAVVALVVRPADAPPTAPPAASVVPTDTVPVVANMTALRPVEARIVVDGEIEFEGTLKRGEARSFEGERAIEVRFAQGKAVVLAVNGTRLGRAGADGEPYTATFRPEDHRGSPSPSGG